MATRQPRQKKTVDCWIIGLIVGTGLLAIALGRLADYVASRLRPDGVEQHDID
ncbi:hypothetical protein EBBID32_4810 [Sphingobium indicum BiD32]|uniref:Uncharacterized protein n=1 Tax=Sphingobium indicum BiD32 TaxID=1301087 RepID=N1MHB1_9SPHN|nr:hypothetical protein EBBID32_4810 [Sphingobium indicum BiD32]